MHYEVAFAALGGLLDLGSPKGLKGYSVQMRIKPAQMRPVSITDAEGSMLALIPVSGTSTRS
ncbi:MAG: hypothetical protein ACYCVY_07870 [Acidiferrobacteraceae bacterium]